MQWKVIILKQERKERNKEFERYVWREKGRAKERINERKCKRKNEWMKERINEGKKERKQIREETNWKKKERSTHTNKRRKTGKM